MPITLPKMVRIEKRASSLERIEKLAQDALPVLIPMAIEMVARTQRAFRQQGRPAGAWPERIVPNIAGILRDLETSPNVKARRFQDRPAVVDTGRLRGSIDWKRIDNLTVDFGTNVPYANRQQRGGRSTITITDRMRDNLAEYLRGQRRRARGGKGAPGQDLGWLFTRKGGGRRAEFSIKVRSRPFVLWLEDDRRRLDQITQRYIRTGKA